ncbi:MAG: hypothetical protein WCF06_05185, partial [Nitrososphaeraceae archaeon]
IPVGASPHRVALCMSKTYVTNSGSNTISVIDGKTNKVVATIPSGYLPNGVASDETYSKIYVTNSGSNNISVINGVNNIGSTENHYCDTK